MYRSLATWLTAGAAGLLPLHSGQAQEPTGETLFVDAGDFASTMLESRASLRARQPRAELQLGPWHATAPLPAKGFGRRLFPEDGVDLQATGDGGQALWRERPEWRDGVVHELPRRNQAATYLFRTLTAAQPTTVELRLGSDDGMALWLNGHPVIAKNVARGIAADQDRVSVDLDAGRNELLFKIHNRTGNHAFFFSVGHDPIGELWRRIEGRYPTESGWFRRDLPRGRHLEWFDESGAAGLSGRLVDRALRRIQVDSGDLLRQRQELRSAEAGADDPRWLELHSELCGIDAALTELESVDLASLRLALEDRVRTWPDRFDGAALERLDRVERRLPILRADLISGKRERASAARSELAAIETFRRTALLANPLLDFDRLLVIRRNASSPKLGLPQNWQGNCSLPRTGFSDEIVTLSALRDGGRQEPFFRPERPSMIADLDLHFDGDRMLFSMIGDGGRWQIWELSADGAQLRQVTPGEAKDVDDYDACYLPDGRIVFGSTRVFQGVPCVSGNDAVANLHLLDEADGSIRRLCFDQDHDWCPTVLNNGRVLFTRWEYSDTPHYFTRLLMHMNPDGTGQMEYYGSNSFWPNSLFFARPIPGHPTRIAAIVSGHHGVPRMGELVLFDPALGRREADGVVQRIPGRGQKVEPVIVDRLVDGSWPKFLHPFPLSESYFLVAAQPSPQDNWGIYLVDVFDNMVCLAEEPGQALLEPIPFRNTKRPPVIPDKVRLDTNEATVFLQDVYHGPGLAGVPRGTVERLRVYALHYGYNKMGGHQHVGMEGPWDVHRILGTVPVQEDGSASFMVPANTPVAIQPLDTEGKAVQLMRSWFVAMPGEVLSCVGCHEDQNTAAPVTRTLAARQPPVAIEPWYGPARGFSFAREVQPVLDRHCVRCHDSTEPPDLSRGSERGQGNFTASYIALHPYVRRPGPESDYHLLRPLEFHADTSELVQMLQKGHHGVTLDAESWDRLITWIDLNVPDHGTWCEHAPIPASGRERRLEMDARHAGLSVDPEAIPAVEPVDHTALAPGTIEPGGTAAPTDAQVTAAGWPFDAPEAARRVRDSGVPPELRLELGDGVTMELVLIPAGEFVLGSRDGFVDELPRTRVAVERPFYLGRVEVTCEQYERFDRSHFNGYHDQRHKDHTTPGYPAHGPRRPVIRITWLQAMAFCRWLGEATGRECRLPTEAEWEWACRAGSDGPFWYGDLDTDFSAFANLADRSISRLAVTGVNPRPIPNPNRFQDFLPKDSRFDDSATLMTDAGRYGHSPFGLLDMHGNVAEWTLSNYRPYPYVQNDGRDTGDEHGRKVVRGGSWRDRPIRSRSASRRAYRPYQPVFDVGFRVLVRP